MKNRFSFSFSVSAAIGFIALFGISVMDGIIILTQFNQLIDAGVARTAAILRTGELQMRPVLMTCVIAGVAAGGGIDRDRIAGAKAACGRGSRGMMLAPVVILITLPVLILLFSRRSSRTAPRGAVTAPAQ